MVAIISRIYLWTGRSNNPTLSRNTTVNLCHCVPIVVTGAIGEEFRNPGTFLGIHQVGGF